MFSISDTIVAIATPPGRGGIGVVRLSGSGSHAIARALTTHRGPFTARCATFTTVALPLTSDPLTSDPLTSDPLTSDPSAEPALEAAAARIDHAIVTFFPAPRSYTGDDVVEISGHGSPVVLRAIVSAAVRQGARAASPGEFTLRAFLNGRIDLTQAEAVADLIESVTPLQARTAFDQLNGTLTQTIAGIEGELFDLIARLEASIDFPDEGYHFIEPGGLARSIEDITARTAALLAGAQKGRLVREGLQIAIVGRPNVGKSSLFNALVGTGRAIVTDVPGTTRDLVSETIDLFGLRVTLVDTAGLRATVDPVEVEGVARSTRAAAAADLTLVVADRSQPWGDAPTIFADPNISPTILVANKADLAPAWQRDEAVAVSARTGAGLDELRCRVARALDVTPTRERPDITNVRHIALVERADAALRRAARAAHPASGSMPEEFVLADLQDARAALEEVTGKRAPDDVLAHIFARFCIGK